MQQSIKDGNFLALILKESPAGLIQRITWRFARMLAMKKDHRDSGLSTFFCLRALGRTLFIISSISSFFLKRLGTSPVFNKLLMLSKNYSYRI